MLDAWLSPYMSSERPIKNVQGGRQVRELCQFPAEG